MITRLFVYGTLRLGAGAFNDMLAPVTAAARPATLADHALYGRGLPYPFVRPYPGLWVVGDVVEIEWSLFDRTIERLDAYEGDQYRRVIVEVDESPTWIYLAVDDLVLHPGQIIASGDWLNVIGPGDPRPP